MEKALIKESMNLCTLTAPFAPEKHSKSPNVTKRKKAKKKEKRKKKKKSIIDKGRHHIYLYI